MFAVSMFEDLVKCKLHLINILEYQRILNDSSCYHIYQSDTHLLYVGTINKENIILIFN